MIKHVCVISAGDGTGSYGVGDDQKAALKKAKSQLYGSRSKEIRYKEVHLDEGEHLQFQTLINGVTWYIVKDGYSLEHCTGCNAITEIADGKPLCDPCAAKVIAPAVAVKKGRRR